MLAADVADLRPAGPGELEDSPAEAGVKVGVGGGHGADLSAILRCQFDDRSPLPFGHVLIRGDPLGHGVAEVPVMLAEADAVLDAGAVGVHPGDRQKALRGPPLHVIHRLPSVMAHGDSDGGHTDARSVYVFPGCGVLADEFANRDGEPAGAVTGEPGGEGHRRLL